MRKLEASGNKHVTILQKPHTKRAYCIERMKEINSEQMILYTGKVPFMIFIKAASVQRRSQMFDTHHLFLRNSMP